MHLCTLLRGGTGVSFAAAAHSPKLVDCSQSSDHCRNLPQISRKMDRMHLTVRSGMQDVAAGEQVTAIPLRLALMDSPDDHEAASCGIQARLQSSYLHISHTPCNLGLRSDFAAMISLRNASPRHATMMCVSGPQDAPWSVRLASKLLRELARGDESRWAPYLQVSSYKLAVAASRASRKSLCC